MSDICYTTSGYYADCLRRVKVQKLQHSPAARELIHFAKAPRGYIFKRRLTQQLQCGTACQEDVEVDAAIVGAGTPHHFMSHDMHALEHQQQITKANRVQELSACVLLITCSGAPTCV